MSEVKTQPVTAQVLRDRETGDPIIGAEAGAIQFYSTAEHKPDAFHFMCPCGCGALGGVTVAGPNAWQWNGSRDKPTVRPSVLLHGKDGPHWHGWLTDGVWRSC